MSGAVSFQAEPYEACCAEIDTYLAEHWRELALDQEAIPLEKDAAAYARLAAEGQLHVVTARRGGELVGYHASVVRPHLHYAGTLHAFVDVYWLRPDCRRGMTGVRLIQEAERSLRRRGVKKIMSGTKLHKDMARIFQRLGWRETERLFTKYIGD